MSLIYMRLEWKRLPKFQHLLNDRQKWQKYPVKFRFPDPIVWKTVRGAKSENQSNPKQRFARNWLLRLAWKRLSASLSCVVGLSSLEPILVNSQGRDF